MPASIGAVRKAVIPAAGFGMRMFPASQAVRKGLMPVVGPDGIARAMIHYDVKELRAAGIEEICVVTQPGGEEEIRAYFAGPDSGLLRRLEITPALFQEARQMPELNEHLRFVVQREQEGYGHAVFQSRAFANGDPVLLCLGDHIFCGAPVSPCRELAEMAPRSGGRSVSAVNRIGPQELKGYGTIAGLRHTDFPRLIDVSRIVEKPPLELAQRELRVDGLPDNEFLGWFGLHLLAPSIYEILDRMIRDNLRDAGEFQLTRAQEMQRQQEGYLALEMDPAGRFDFGTPWDYAANLARFALGRPLNLKG